MEIGIIKKYKKLPVQVRASIWFLICSFLQKGISMLTTPIFTRLLTTAEFGDFNAFNSWYSIINIIISLNLYAGVYTQGLVKYDEEKEVFSSSLLGLTTTLVCAFSVIYFLFRDYFNSLFSLTTVQMVCMFLMILSTAAFNFWATYQRVLYKYRGLVILTLVVSILKPVVGIELVLNSSDKVTARILGLTIVEVVSYFALYVVRMRKGNTFYSKKFWKYAIFFNLPLIPHYLSQSILNSSDRLMIKNMVGSSEAGIYSLAYSISMIMILFNTSLSQTISPWIYQRIKDKQIKDIAPIGYLSLIIIAVANLILIMIAPEVIRIFAPKEYYDAIYIIPPLAMSVFFLYGYDLFSKFAFYYEKTHFIMFASIGGAIVNVILNAIFIRKYGYVAAAYTTVTCYFLYFWLHYVFMVKVCNRSLSGEKPYNKSYIMLLCAVFVIIGFILLITYDYPIARYCLFAITMIALLIHKNRIIDSIKKLRKLRSK